MCFRYSCRFYTILQSLFYRFAPPRKVQFVNYSTTQNSPGWLAGWWWSGCAAVSACLNYVSATSLVPTLPPVRAKLHISLPTLWRHNQL